MLVLPGHAKGASAERVPGGSGDGAEAGPARSDLAVPVGDGR